MGASGDDARRDGNLRQWLRRAVETAFGLRVTSLVPVRSAYKVSSPQGLFCLREVRRQAQAKLFFLHQMTEFLWGRGFPRVPRFFPTRAGEVGWPLGSRVFSLSGWLPGEECRLERRADMEAAARGLAALHRASVGFPLRPEHAPAVRWGMWAEEMAEGERLLNACLQRASAAPRPASLDRWLIRNSPWVAGRIAKAREGLAELAVPLAEWGPGVFCHNSLYYQNILVDPGRTICFVDLDRAVWDHRARDLAHFLDRYLQRVGWREDLAYAALNAYSEVWPLSPLDRQLLYLRLLFPERLLKRLWSHYGPKAKELRRATARVVHLARHGRQRAAFLERLAGWVESGRPPR
ncbi:MAG: phosphotransferase [Bacillota bacterium]|nr:phosphotransferase [Bacillota bacterium]